jgi:cell division septation protein DedD
MGKKGLRKRRKPAAKQTLFHSIGREIPRWLLFVVVSCWIFLLGVLVGRESAPVYYTEMPDMRAGLLSLQRAEQQKEEQESEALDRTEDTPPLDFHESLKKSDERKYAKASEKPSANPAFAEGEEAGGSAVKKKQKKAEFVKPSRMKSGKERDKIKTAPAGEDGRYTIQIASFKNREDAFRRVSELKKNGFPAYVSRGEVPRQGIWHRVRVGAFTDEKSAKDIMTKLRNNLENEAILVNLK